MKEKEFNEIVEFRCSEIKRILEHKAKEYASDNDRLHNFKLAGIRRQCSPEEALMGMKEKHSVAIEDMINDIKYGTFNRDEVYINEKVGDEINYLILLEALLKERIRNNIMRSNHE